jgi:hypothetical protein
MVGTASGTTVGAATDVGTTVIPVASGTGFSAGQAIAIDSGANQETAVVVSTTGGRGGATITVAAPLTFSHAAGVQVSGSGITLTAALTLAHASGAQVSGSVPTPGAPNRYYIPVAYVNPLGRVSGSGSIPTVPARPPALVMIHMRRFWMR